MMYFSIVLNTSFEVWIVKECGAQVEKNQVQKIGMETFL